MVEGNELKKLFQIKGLAYTLKCQEVETNKPISMYQTDIQALLTKFYAVFEIPTGLPPYRSCDHKISLTDPNQAIHSRSYNYPFHQKNEVERQVKEMLNAGIIRHSSSPLASLVVLVRKFDGIWRLCIYYRALNKIIVKDNFPIPMIDDFLDELYGAQFFSKLDLKSGYH